MSASTAIGLGYAPALRLELSFRNQKYAAAHTVPHALSYGEQPVVCFEPYDNDQRHGNFLPQTYLAILKNDNWRLRLAKPHTSARGSLPRTRAWKELDSSNSSDALLMNVFCYPGVFRDGRVCGLLGVEPGSVPEFGVKARVPLASGRFDRTEVDMRLGSLLVEAKLTENDFQTREREIVETYRDFADVFDRRALASANGRYASYQLIRNVLAARASGASFCVLCDARRPDLVQAWYEVMRCVRPAELRVRCKVLTWQELAVAAPARLQRFLDEKYGIASGQVLNAGT